MASTIIIKEKDLIKFRSQNLLKSVEFMVVNAYFFGSPKKFLNFSKMSKKRFCEILNYSLEKIRFFYIAGLDR